MDGIKNREVKIEAIRKKKKKIIGRADERSAVNGGTKGNTQGSVKADKKKEERRGVKEDTKRDIRRKDCLHPYLCILCAVVLTVAGVVQTVSGGENPEVQTVSGDRNLKAQTVNSGENQVVQAQTGGGKSSGGERQSDLYGIGSTSKVITAAAVMKLEEEGRIDLDAPLTDYIPEFQMADERYITITPRMLLDHTSGLQGSTLVNAMLLGDVDSYNHDHLLTLLKEQRLKAEPGKFAVYCNDGFTLAEILVERVSGMSFTEYAEKEFAGPLGLTHFKTPQNLGGEEYAADVFDSISGKMLPYEAANVIGSGGFYATAEDLVRFSQIFMRDQGVAAGILSIENAMKMEHSDYVHTWNPEGKDANFSYGLGWDSVDTYPFSRYGVKALVKGGDTGFYHASLTVLPEENISCAVLTSSSGSVVPQLAVQEILMTYLDEIGRIERDEAAESRPEESELEKVNLKEDIKAYEGRYAGMNLFAISEPEPDMLLLTTSESGHEKSQRYERDSQGRLLSIGGDYISGAGAFVKGSNGNVGKTYLDFKTFDGKQYMMASTYEKYPGMGTLSSYLPIGVKLEERGSTMIPAANESWKKQEGKNFYLVSEKYSSMAYMNRFSIKPLLPEMFEGYLTFQDQKLQPALITGDKEAEFFQEIPGQTGRDLNDYRLEEQGKKIFLVTSGFRYLSEDGIPDLKSTGSEVSIEESGEAVWFSISPEEQYGSLAISAPASGSWYLYDESGRDAKCIASSWVTLDGEALSLPKRGKIVFVGESGTNFLLSSQE